MLHHSSASRRWKQWFALPLVALLLIIVGCDKTTYTGALPEPQAAQSSTVFTPPVIKADSASEDPANKVYFFVEQMPAYPGSFPKLLADIQGNLHYPPAALAAGLEGKVFVQFIVEKDGTVSGVRARNGIKASADQVALAQAMDREAVRAVQELPERWQSGKQGGQPIRVSYVVPVSFAK